MSVVFTRLANFQILRFFYYANGIQRSENPSGQKIQNHGRIWQQILQKENI